MAYVALVDLRSRRIPNVVTVPGTALAIVLAATGGGSVLTGAASGAALAIAITGAMFVAARGRFGMGDVKLAGLCGAVLGVAVVPLFLVVASLFGSAAAVAVLLRGGDRNTTIAYGPFMATAGALLCWWLGPAVG